MEPMMGKQRYLGAFQWLVVAIGGVVLLFSVYQLPRYSLPRLDLTFLAVALFTTAICVMALVQYAFNSGLIAAAQSCKIDQPFWQTWRKYYLWSSVTYVAGAYAAGIVAKLVHSVGFYAVLATAPIIAIVYA